MAVLYECGDIFTAPTHTVVNTVNTKGVMGKGLALQFKQRFPQMYHDYRQRCQRGEVRVGRPYLYTGSHPWILNFPTKDHWRYPSRLEWIRDGLKWFVAHYREWGVESIAFPQLGTDLGGLSWNEVQPLMHAALDPLDIEVRIYTYQAAQGAPHTLRSSRRMARTTVPPSSTPAASPGQPAALAAIERYDDALTIDWLNTASAEDLQHRLGLEPGVAAAVVAHRDAAGYFQTLQQLRAVKSIGPKRYRRIAKALETPPTSNQPSLL
jgi:O-acetyl-ADP-ribose deacetylase (regulator of RNase III)